MRLYRPSLARAAEERTRSRRSRPGLADGLARGAPWPRAAEERTRWRVEKDERERATLDNEVAVR